MVECKRQESYYMNSRRVYARHHGLELIHKDVVRHTCDHNWCVEITHLELGTHQDNSRDMVRRGRMNPATSKLEQRHVDKIRAMKGTMSQRELAYRFNVSRQTINSILNNKSWVEDSK